MTPPILFLLPPGFEDPAYGEGQFFCPDCLMMEGWLAVNPEAAAQLDVRRVEFPRPRTAIIELIGEERQACPVLIISPEEVYVGADRIVGALAEILGTPRLH